MRELNRKMAKGVAWMAVLKISVRGIGLVSTVILARLLVPADFGLIAMAMSVIAFLELATAFSFDIPLIQNQDADRKHFDTAWTLNILFYSGLTALLLVLAVPAANFYQEPRLAPVIYILAAGFFVSGFSNIGVVYFRKELNFKKDFLVMVSRRFLGFMITIPLAFWLRSYWALVIGMVSGNILRVLTTYLLHPFRPRLSLARASEMLGFSKWLVLNNAIQFLRHRSPTFIIGRVSGASDLGLFTVAYEVSAAPITEIVAPINRAVFPGYAKLADDRSQLRQSFCDTLAVIAIAALPIGMGVAVVSEPLIDVIFGKKWSEAAPLVSILAMFGALHSLHTNSGSIYNAIGKPYLITLTGFVNVSVLLVASIFLIGKFGLIGIAAAYLGTSVMLTPFNFYILCTQIGLSASQLLGVLWRPTLSAVLMAVSVAFVDKTWLTLSTPSTGARLIVLVLTGAFIYSLSLSVFWLLSGNPKSAVEYRLLMIVWRFAKRKLGDG